METRARYATIGFFTLVVTVAAFIFIYWLKRLDEEGVRVPLYLEFAGTVGGLAPGGWVYFAGIKVGNVTALAFDPEHPNTVLVTAEVKSDTPIKADTRAQVGANLLTGVAYVELLSGSPEAVSVFDLKPPKLVGTQSAFSDVVAAANNAVAKVDRIVDRVDKFVAANEESITDTVGNVKTFTDALAKNSDGVEAFLANVAEMSKTVSGLSERLNGLVEKADKIVAAVDPEKVRGAVDNADQFIKRLNDASTGVDGVVADVKKAVADISEFSGGLKKTLADVQEFVAGIDQTKITAAIDNVTGFTDRLKTAGPDIDALIADAKATVANTNTFTANLNTKQADFDQIVADVKKVVADVSGVSGGFKTTLDDIQKFVVTFDRAKISSAIDNISGFTDKLDAAGPDIDSVIADAKATAKSANEFTASLNARKDDFNKIVTDAKALAERLNATSTRLDSILGKADDMLATEGGKNFFQQASDAAKAIREAAETITKRADQVAVGLSKFSGRGLDNVSQLVNELRASVARIDRAVAQISSDPSSVVFGGKSGVREYNRR